MHDLTRGTIVVTGGAGLIGSALVWALNRRGLDDILIVDRLDDSDKVETSGPAQLRRLCRRGRVRTRASATVRRSAT